jgi:hypothetical protein
MTATGPRPRRTTPAALVCAAAAAWLLGPPAWLLAPPARAEMLINPQGWKFPNIVIAAKKSIKVSDRTPAIPGKETMLKGYQKGDGTFFQTYEIEGRVFGVEIDTDGKPPFEYSILDTDGDGKFETKIPHTPGNTDRAYVPKWVIEHYYARHPELQNPDAPARPAAPRLVETLPPPPPEKPKTEPPAGPLPEEIRALPNP